MDIMYISSTMASIFFFEQLVVWVDPLDGTSEYTQGNMHPSFFKLIFFSNLLCHLVLGNLDHVTVLIGVAHKNTPVGGVIHQPYHNYTSGGSDLGRTLWGIPGIGCGGFKPLPPPEGRRVIATTRSHMTDLVLQTIEALKPDEVLKVGGAGFKVLSRFFQYFFSKLFLLDLINNL